MVNKELFGKLNSQDVFSYILTNKNGMSVKFCDFGASILSLFVPDRDGKFSDVVAGFDNLDDYIQAEGYLGATIGRVCNRISNGQYFLNGKKYFAYKNNGKNSLHGGKIGFSHKVWSAQVFDSDEPCIIFSLESLDGEEGYSGNLNVSVKYTLLLDNSVMIDYRAECDQDTIVNLTNHSYFNLGGYDSGEIFDHIIKIDADEYIPTNADLIPTGEIRSVFDTPFDFRKAKKIGENFDLTDNDLKLAGGFDHCLCFGGGESKEPICRIEVYEPKSGRVMHVVTNQPCVQFYTANFLCDYKYPLKGGYPQNKQNFFCLETQKMPDAINHSGFDDIVLKKGDVYKYQTIYKFSTK